MEKQGQAEFGRDSFATHCSNPLVVGAPRSGFSLLISIINTLLQRHSKPSRAPDLQPLLTRVVDLASFYLTQRYKQAFAQFGIVQDLIFNGEFHLVTGGPKWLDKSEPQPRVLPQIFWRWGHGGFPVSDLPSPRNPRIRRRASLTHVASVVARAVSLRRVPEIHVGSQSDRHHQLSVFFLKRDGQRAYPKIHAARERGLHQTAHGSVQTLNLDVFRGLIQFLKNYLDEYLTVADRYFVMRWEDLIDRPVETNQKVASALKIPCSEKEAEAIWRPMDHVNLLRFHKHNYRSGKGIVGDWKNSLLNEHMELFREFGFDHYLAELGYPAIPDLGPSRLFAATTKSSLNATFGEERRSRTPATQISSIFLSIKAISMRVNLVSSPCRTASARILNERR